MDIRCKDGECTVEKKKKQYPYFGHFCHCSDQTEVWDSTQMTGEYVDIIVSGVVSEDLLGDVASVFTGVECNGGSGSGSCGLEFSTTGVAEAKAVFKTKKGCVFCQLETLADGEDIEITGLASVGGVGEVVPLAGQYIDIPDGMDVSCSTGSGSGSGSGSTCSAALTTKRYCVIACGDAVAGDDIDLDFDAVEITTDTYFRQDGLSLKLDNCRVAVCVPCVDLTEVCDTDTVTGIDCASGSGS
jgi:hypothetical protein